MKNIKSAEKSNVENYSTKLSLQLQNNLQKWILKEYNWEDYHPTSHPKAWKNTVAGSAAQFTSQKNLEFLSFRPAGPFPKKTKQDSNQPKCIKAYLLQPPTKKNNQPPSSLSRPTWPSGHFAIPSPCMGSWCPWRFLFGAFQPILSLVNC